MLFHATAADDALLETNGQGGGSPAGEHRPGDGLVSKDNRGCQNPAARLLDCAKPPSPGLPTHSRPPPETTPHGSAEQPRSSTGLLTAG